MEAVGRSRHGEKGGGDGGGEGEEEEERSLEGEKGSAASEGSCGTAERAQEEMGAQTAPEEGGWSNQRRGGEGRVSEIEGGGVEKSAEVRRGWQGCGGAGWF